MGAAVLAVVAVVVADEDLEVWAAVVTVAVLLGAVWLYRGWSKQQTGGPGEDLVRWHRAIRAAMAASWTGERSPLASIEALGDLARFRNEQSLVHQVSQNAQHLDDGIVLRVEKRNSPLAVFDRLEGSYLLVGEAGAGKSVWLWRTLRELLKVAEDRRITPLLVEAYHWSTQGPGATWQGFLAGRLQTPDIGATPNIAEQLVKEGRLVVLLDGLDELHDTDPVAAQRLLEAIERAQPRQVVMTSRSGQYDAITKARHGQRFAGVRYGTQLERWTREAVRDHLTARTEERGITRLLDDLNVDPRLGELLRSPLWLAVATTVYTDPSTNHPQLRDELAAAVDDPTRHGVLYRRWVAHQLTDIAMNPNDPHDQRTVDEPGTWYRHLRFVATRMHTSGIQTVHLDDIRPGFLPEHLRRRALRPIARSVGLLVGLVAGLLDGVVVGLRFGVRVGLVAGLLIGLLVGVVVERLAGVAPWLVLLVTQEEPVRVGQRYEWTRLLSTEARGTIRDQLVGALRFGLSAGLLAGLFAGLSFGPRFGLVAGLVAGLLFGLVAGLSTGLTEVSVPVPLTDRPGSRAWALRVDARTRARHSLVWSLVWVLLFGLSVGLVAGLVAGLLFGLVLALIVPFAVLAESVLIRHFFASRVAVRAGLLPRDLEGFLDQAESTGLMYRAGAGSRFRHRTLTDWIIDTPELPARIDLTPPTRSSPTEIDDVTQPEELEEPPKPRDPG